jgi:hypothetical protein
MKKERFKVWFRQSVQVENKWVVDFTANLASDWDDMSNQMAAIVLGWADPVELP